MNRIEKLLSIGDLRTAGKSEEVVKMVSKKPKLFDDVVNAIQVDNPAARMRAADAVEKITRDHPEWLKPYKKILLSKLANIDQKEVRWHIAQILPRLNLTKKERKKVFNLMLTYLEDDSRIVKTFAMQALTDIAVQDNSYAEKVRGIVKNLMKNGAPSMMSRGKKLLVTLDGL
jgi:hypothetical protein